MNYFGKSSREKIQTLHPDLRLILNTSIEFYDFSVIEGIRTAEKQYEYFTSNPPKTTLDGYKKKSKHQGKRCSEKESGKKKDGSMYLDSDGYPICSFAVDIVPYKKGYDAWSEDRLNLSRFYFMMGIIKSISERLLREGLVSHRVRFGLDWDSDDIYSDQSFHDLPHIELVPV